MPEIERYRCRLRCDPDFLGPHKIAGKVIRRSALIRLRGNAVKQSRHRLIGVAAINIDFRRFIVPVDLLPDIRFPTVIPRIVNVFVIRCMIPGRLQNARRCWIAVIDHINTHGIPVVKSRIRSFRIGSDTPLNGQRHLAGIRRCRFGRRVAAATE